jgi:hypothetical protein
MKIFNLQHKQTGAVLVVALVLLVVLTMLGISAIEATKLETRMAANTREYNQAFQNAEAGLRYANNLVNESGGNMDESDVLEPVDEAFEEILDGGNQIQRFDPDIAEVRVMLPPSEFELSSDGMVARIIVVQSIGKSARGQRVELSGGLRMHAPSKNPSKLNLADLGLSGAILEEEDEGGTGGEGGGTINPSDNKDEEEEEGTHSP